MWDAIAKITAQHTTRKSSKACSFCCCRASYYIVTGAHAHQDIKPANVILTEEAKVILIDFDLAERYPTLATQSGTIPWMAYDEVVGGRLTSLTDLQSLSYLALTIAGKELPWNMVVEDKDDWKKLEQKMQQEIANTSALCKHLPPVFEEFFRMAHSKHPKKFSEYQF